MFQQIGNLKVTYSVHTQAGADLGGNVKDNQDAWCVQECLAGQDMAMFGVFDGHGQEGKVVSHSMCTNVPKALAKHGACKVGAMGGMEQYSSGPGCGASGMQLACSHMFAGCGCQVLLALTPLRRCCACMRASSCAQPATLELALSDAFPDANNVLKRTPGLDADLSGSTGIVAVSQWRGCEAIPT